MRCDKTSGIGRKQTLFNTLGINDAAPGAGFVKSQEDAKKIFTSWRTRRRGTTHWKALITRLEISALNIGQPFVHADDRRILDIDCSTDLLLPSNFSFNSPGAIKYSSSLDKVRDLIYSHRDNCESFVDAYLALYQPVHPILDPPRFIEEINCFWEDGAQTDVSWLSTSINRQLRVQSLHMVARPLFRNGSRGRFSGLQ
ncbi:hypothetical protein J3F83DRAFT_768584 [Trichoderma novae-zelandiae]